MWYINEELYHHGIQGQKWGIRRYQNEDGSYTEAGRRRYNDGEGYSNRSNNSERRYNRNREYSRRYDDDDYDDYRSSGSKSYNDSEDSFAMQIGKTFIRNAISGLGTSFGNSFGNMLGQLPGTIANASVNEFFRRQSDERAYEHNRLLNEQRAALDTQRMEAEHRWTTQRDIAQNRRRIAETNADHDWQRERTRSERLWQESRTRSDREWREQQEEARRRWQEQHRGGNH